MQDDDLVEKAIDVERVLIFDEVDWMLAIEIYRDIAGVAAFPVDLNHQVVVPRIELHSHRSIAITIDEVIDIGPELIARLVNL